MGNMKIFAQTVCMCRVAVSVNSPVFLLGQKILQPWERTSTECWLPSFGEQTLFLSLGNSVALLKVSLISSCFPAAIKYPFPINLEIINLFLYLLVEFQCPISAVSVTGHIWKLNSTACRRLIL